MKVSITPYQAPGCTRELSKSVGLGCGDGETPNTEKSRYTI